MIDLCLKLPEPRVPHRVVLLDHMNSPTNTGITMAVIEAGTSRTHHVCTLGSDGILQLWDVRHQLDQLGFKVGGNAGFPNHQCIRVGVA